MNETSGFEEALGHEIRAWRQRRGLTIVQLAEKAGVSKATLERLENATHSTSVVTTWKLAEALGVALSKLVARAEQALVIDGVPESKWDRPSEGLAPEDRAALLDEIDGSAEDVLGYASDPAAKVSPVVRQIDDELARLRRAEAAVKRDLAAAERTAKKAANQPVKKAARSSRKKPE